MSKNSALSAHLPTPQQARPRKGTEAQAVVRDQNVSVSGLTEALRLLPDGGPDLKGLILTAADGLEALTPYDADDTVYVRNLKAARDAVERIRSEETPAAWDMDKALRLVGQAIFSAFEAPAPAGSGDKSATSQAIAREAVRQSKPPSQAKAAARLPDNLLDKVGARAVYAARRKPV